MISANNDTTNVNSTPSSPESDKSQSFTKSISPRAPRKGVHCKRMGKNMPVIMDNYFYPEFTSEFSAKEHALYSNLVSIISIKDIRSGSFDETAASVSSDGTSDSPIERRGSPVAKPWKTMEKAQLERVARSVKKLLIDEDFEKDVVSFAHTKIDISASENKDQILRDIHRAVDAGKQENKEEIYSDMLYVLVFYCKEKQMMYQQGMHDILYPFLRLKYKGEITIAEAYAYFVRFIKKYIANNLTVKITERGPELPHLKCSLTLCEILLKYHDKELYDKLKSNDIFFEMFATGWFLNLFSRNFESSLLWEFWEMYLYERDYLFTFYIAVALLLFSRQKLMEMTSMEELIYFLINGIKISTIKDLANVYYIAVNVRSNTPLSFGLLVKNLKIFDNAKISSNEELSQIARFKACNIMPIYEEELTANQEGAKEYEDLYTMHFAMNNNKYHNAFILHNGELQRMLSLSTYSDVESTENDAIKRINALKFTLDDQTRLGRNVDIKISDCRVEGAIWKKLLKLSLKSKKIANIEQEAEALDKKKSHICVMTSRNNTGKMSKKEQELYSKTMGILSTYNGVGIIHYHSRKRS